MDKRFLAIILVVIGVLGGVFWFTRPDTGNPNFEGQVSNHIHGAGNKDVNLTEYGDFQCPACGAYYPVVKQLRIKYGDDITFQFRNFPISSKHPNAFAAHRAAEAAGMQGKFFDMHDLLFEGQDSWGASSSPKTFFDNYAQQLGLDMTKFNSDFASEQVNATINADLSAGKVAGVEGTPTFFLDGKKIDSPRDQAAFEKLIDDAIAAKAGATDTTNTSQ